MAPVAIQLLSATHAATLARLERRCFSTAWSADQFAEAMAGGHFTAFGAFRQDELVAYLGVQHIGEEAEIVNIAVLKEERRHGIGSALLCSMLSWAPKAGLNVCFLEVREGNLPARKLYEKHGFRFEGKRRNYYQSPCEDALVMKWSAADTVFSS